MHRFNLRTKQLVDFIYMLNNTLIKYPFNEFYKKFNKSYNNVKYFKNWGSIYYQLEIWESFIPEDYINEWEIKIEYYSEKIIDTMKKIRPIIEKDIIKIKI